jgi:hypothetical protein
MDRAGGDISWVTCATRTHRNLDNLLFFRLLEKERDKYLMY